MATAYNRAIPRVVAWPSASVPTILAMRDVAPGWTTAFAAIGLAAAGFAFAASYSRNPTRAAPIPWQMMLLAFALVSMVVLAIVNGAVEVESLLGVALVFTAAGFVGLALLRCASGPDQIIRVASEALAILVVASTVLWLLGVESLAETGPPAGDKPTLLAQYGIGELRTMFPLTFGYTSHAAICGAALVMLWPRAAHDWKTWLPILCAGFGAIVSEGRMALFGIVFVLGCMPFIRREGWGRFVPLSAFLLPFSAVVFMAVTTWMPDAVLELFARTGEAREIRSGNHRMDVWFTVLDEVSRNPFAFVFGYGFFGQAASGISENYAFIFKGWQGDLRFYSVHNAGLQILVDGGIIALAAVFAWYAWMLQTFVAHQERTFAKSGINVVVFVLIVGMMDITGTPVQREIFFALMLVGFAAMRTMEQPPAKRRRRRYPVGQYPYYPR